MADRKPKSNDASPENAAMAGALGALLKRNPGTDWRTMSLDDAVQAERIDGLGQVEDEGRMIGLLKAYQRLLRILPECSEDLALGLIEADITSAVQIASMPKSAFRLVWKTLHANHAALADTVYQNARNKRSLLLLDYMNRLQNNEPHYRATRIHPARSTNHRP